MLFMILAYVFDVAVFALDVFVFRNGVALHSHLGVS